MNGIPLELVREDLKSVEARMRNIPFSAPAPVTETLGNMLAAGGKRLRPALALLFGRMLRVPEDPLISLSASLEVIHTATLIHDDLVDHAPLRRGIPTRNAEWPAGMTVLAGDFLFAWAARLAAATGSLPVMQKFAGALTAIVDGEIRQVSAADSVCDVEEYESRIESKTAALFEVACAGPALLAEDPSSADRASRYGRSFGMAFQIADDILDFTADGVRTGKPAGQDLRQGLVTLPAILHFAAHPDDPDVAAFRAGVCDPERRGRLIETIRSSGAIEESRRRVRSYVDGALEALSAFPKDAYRDALESMANTIS